MLTLESNLSLTSGSYSQVQAQQSQMPVQHGMYVMNPQGPPQFMCLTQSPRAVSPFVQQQPGPSTLHPQAIPTQMAFLAPSPSGPGAPGGPSPGLLPLPNTYPFPSISPQMTSYAMAPQSCMPYGSAPSLDVSQPDSSTMQTNANAMQPPCDQSSSFNPYMAAATSPTNYSYPASLSSSFPTGKGSSPESCSSPTPSSSTGNASHFMSGYPLYAPSHQMGQYSGHPSHSGTNNNSQQSYSMQSRGGRRGGHGGGMNGRNQTS